MIHYHGGPITPDTCAIRAWQGRHAFISFANKSQLALATEISQSFGIDNGAFTFWQKGKVMDDWDPFYQFVEQWKHHPRFDFAIIPDVIGGGEKENDDLLDEWPHGDVVGVPVWHMDESDERLIRLAEKYPRVAIGSCGTYDVKYPKRCIQKLHDALRWIVNEQGFPKSKLHGLRMLNKDIFTQVPLSSADSTNVAQNIGKDKNWTGSYQPRSKETRASIMVERIESFNSASCLSTESKEVMSLQLGLVF